MNKIISILVLVLLAGCTVQAQERNIREATPAEVTAGTLGLPAVITPRRLAGAGGGGGGGVVATNGTFTNLTVTSTARIPSGTTISTAGGNSGSYLFMEWASGGVVHSNAIQSTLSGFNVIGNLSANGSLSGNTVTAGTANFDFGAISTDGSGNLNAVSYTGLMNTLNLNGTVITSFPQGTVVVWMQIQVKFGTTNLFIPCVYTNL